MKAVSDGCTYILHMQLLMQDVTVSHNPLQTIYWNSDPSILPTDGKDLIFQGPFSCRTLTKRTQHQAPHPSPSRLCTSLIAIVIAHIIAMRRTSVQEYLREEKNGKGLGFSVDWVGNVGR